NNLRYCRVSRYAMLSVLLASVFVFLGTAVQDPVAGRISSAREMVKQRRYQDAINALEDILDKRPAQADAVSLLAASNMYSSGDFVRALGSFEEAIKAGGYAIFWVSHSHEKIGTSELADYCRGWLYIRANEIEFVPDNSDHGFRLVYTEV